MQIELMMAGPSLTTTPCRRPYGRPLRHEPPVLSSLLLGVMFVKLTHFDWRPTGDGGLAPPRYRLVQVSGLQYPKTAHVLLGLQVGSVGDQHLPPGQGPERLRAGWWVQAASEKPDTSSRHLFVEHIDIADHCLALEGR